MDAVMRSSDAVKTLSLPSSIERRNKMVNIPQAEKDMVRETGMIINGIKYVSYYTSSTFNRKYMRIVQIVQKLLETILKFCSPDLCNILQLTSISKNIRIRNLVRS